MRSETGTWLTSAELDAVGVPHGVRAVIRRRLASLAGPTRRALDVAAVCGLSFDDRTVRTVTGGDVDATVDAFDEARAAGLIREESPGRFTFVHALVRHTTLDELSGTAIARLHWRVAEALQLWPIDPDQVGAVAHHFAAGADFGDPVMVVRASLEAGDEAMSTLGFEEAADHFRTALGALDRSPRDTDLRYRTLISLGAALNALAEADVAHEPWLEAAVIANDNGDPDRMYEALRGYVQMIRVRPPDEFRDLVDNLLQLLPPGDSSLRAAALGWHAVPWMGGDLSTLTPGDQRMADEAVAMARRLGDATALGSALRSRLSSAEYGAGDLQRILEDARELVALRALRTVQISPSRRPVSCVTSPVS